MSIITAIIAISILSSLVDWLFIRTPLADFMVYQFMNRKMFREAPNGIDEDDFENSQKGAGFLISFMFGLLFVIFWTVFDPKAPAWVVAGLLWFAVLVPFATLQAVYLDVNVRYVVQLLSVWLIKLFFAGVIISTLL